MAGRNTDLDIFGDEEGDWNPEPEEGQPIDWLGYWIALGLCDDDPW